MIYGDGGHASVVRIFVDQLGPDVVAIGDNRIRKKEVERLLKEGWEFSEPHIHWEAYVAVGVRLGGGTVVMAGAMIQPRVKIGRHVIINTGATIDHDCVIGDYAHIAPGAHLCGGVHVGDGALVGVGVGIAPGAQIPAWHLVKARKLEIEPL